MSNQFSPEASDELYEEILKSLEADGVDLTQSEDLPPKPFVFITFNRTREFIGRATWTEYRIHPTKPRRSCGIDIYIVFSHPRIQEITKDIRACLKVAAVAAAIAAIVSAIGTAGGSTAGVTLATFKAALYACLFSKGIGWASEIGIDLETENKSCGDWKRL